MDGRCTQKKITLEYPKHRFTPEDLLVFIESKEFTETWATAGLDDENDLASLQLCIMAQPEGDYTIEGAGGLRCHRHQFEWDQSKGSVMVYYTLFEDYGIVYLSCIDTGKGDVTFSDSERKAIRDSLAAAKRELDRKQTLR